MVLTPGTLLGPYEITAAIGKGGMGEVYRALDPKLKRDVAIKVLPDEMATDRDRMQRFEREAQLLASLNHTNIAAIYGLDSVDGTNFLVLELVEGEDLSERLGRGALPLDETVAIARQIIDALESAHAKDIIHRDLKPANIKLRKDGTVKVLDFGLAKVLVDENDAMPDASLSPTLTRAATQAWMLMGTAAYMSPEQARGKSVDARSDIWAFGCVLYEMLTGRRLFRGETISDTLAAVLKTDPDWTELPRNTPDAVQRLLRRLLARDVSKRLQAIGDARLEFDEEEAESTRTPVPSEAPPLVRRMLPWSVAATAMLIAVSSFWGRPARNVGLDSGSAEPMYLDVPYPPHVEPIWSFGNGFAISPDGQSVAVIGARQGVRRLYVRHLDRPEAIEIPSSEGVNLVAFAPDGESVVFVSSDASVVRFSLIDLERSLVTSAGADPAGGVVWIEAGIVFVRRSTLWIISPDGGDARALTTLDEARREVLHTDPIVMPEGLWVLFSSLTRDSGSARIEAVSLDGQQRTVLLERATTPIWSRSGHLLFGRDGAILAAPFDPDSLSLEEAVPIIRSGVVRVVASGGPGMQMSPSGAAAYLPFDSGSLRIVSVRRDGLVQYLDMPAARYSNPRVSPSGERLVVERDGRTLETLDIARGARQRLLAAAEYTSYPTWSSDGRHVVFRRFNSPFWAATDGTDAQGIVPAGSAGDFPSGAGPDADSFLSTRVQPETGGDVFLVSASGSFEPRSLVASRAYEGGAELSPDGRWLLYQSDDSGRPEIYVGRYPELDRRFQASEGLGIQARWNRDGKEIFYRSGDNLMAVPFEGSGTTPTFGKPSVVFSDEYEFGYGRSIANYSVTPNGEFIMLRSDSRGESLRLILNWQTELERLLAQGGLR